MATLVQVVVDTPLPRVEEDRCKNVVVYVEENDDLYVAPKEMLKHWGKPSAVVPLPRVRSQTDIFVDLPHPKRQNSMRYVATVKLNSSRWLRLIGSVKSLYVFDQPPRQPAANDVVKI